MAMFDPQNPEMMELSRQRKMADLLMSRGMETPQGQTVSGGVYVPPSPLKYIANLYSTYKGAEKNKELDAKELELAKALMAQKAQATQGILGAALGGPQQVQQAGPTPEGGNIAPQTVMQRPDLAQALRLASEDRTGAGAAFMPTLLKNTLPEDTTDYRNFLKVKADYDAKGIPITFDQYQDMDANRKRPVTNVSVNTGQHGFDNALKLRSDFRAEPVYKGFEETKAAKNQIDQAAKMASPAGDLAAATKIMKILDPGSVVRESELGMAMAATGVEDRVRNYAQMVIDGTKLTPKQRTDFVDLSNKLYNASAEQFNQKRSEYSGIAQRNKLDVEAAVGAPAEIKGNQGWRIK